MIHLTHRTRLVLLGITLFFVVVGYSYYGNKQSLQTPKTTSSTAVPDGAPEPKLPTSAGKQPSKKPVEVYPVVREELFDKVEVLGTAQANESVDLSSTVTETIKSISFTDGEYVLKDNVLAILEQDEEQAQLKAAQAQLEEHQRELDRLQRLFKKKAASKRTVEERQTQVVIAEQMIEEIKARIADRTITAPFDGVLGIRQVSVGALVSTGDVLTTIDDIHRIKLDFYVPSIFLPQLKRGNEVKAKVEALNQRVFEGNIDTINTRIDPVTRSVLVRAVLPNPDLVLKPGLLMKIDLVRNQREALTIPEESVIQRKNRFYALVINDENIVTEQEIEVGTHYPGKMEVIAGINEGDKVVVRGIHTVRNGEEVEITKEWGKIREPLTGGL